jgi:hypothetical protein
LLHVPAGCEADGFPAVFDFFGSGVSGLGCALDDAEGWPIEEILALEEVLALEVLFGSASVNSGSAEQTGQIQCPSKQ